jgi:hypothetical protein
VRTAVPDVTGALNLRLLSERALPTPTTPDYYSKRERGTVNSFGMKVNSCLNSGESGSDGSHSRFMTYMFYVFTEDGASEPHRLSSGL